MLAAAGIIMTAIVIAMFEVPSLLKNKFKKELWVFGLLLTFATGLNVAMCVDVKIPNPLDFMTMVFKPVSDLIFSSLE
ncbi:hypothetical protein [Alkalihalobacillus deserti]|uniref:hypothetical protein n=1 Tax=Alkalihalobacillus deserti TaxID=2879466 RepID=UPI001D155684|nr:hypothetical protein [Alkalihalobacillus deserti]